MAAPPKPLLDPSSPLETLELPLMIMHSFFSLGVLYNYHVHHFFIFNCLFIVYYIQIKIFMLL